MRACVFDDFFRTSTLALVPARTRVDAQGDVPRFDSRASVADVLDGVGWHVHGAGRVAVRVRRAERPPVDSRAGCASGTARAAHRRLRLGRDAPPQDQQATWPRRHERACAGHEHCEPLLALVGEPLDGRGKSRGDRAE